ncbi:tryptophan 2,3-dioxygenase family protein [Gangjinia marincola]|uniref:Tryptophan 2,3-dioxygenase family protein n=1 Tax=Gangjinia marincola TaxID=578463 RepID=A0ABP3XUA5_9FLAO
MAISPEIEERIHQLEEKFRNSGQDMSSYLDGLLHDRYLTYWDYIHLDTLLSLQNPKTPFPDEMIFVTYHQITELYFKLIIHEQLQIKDNPQLSADFFAEKIERINRYFRVLINSFDVMIKGMERAQFLKYRMSLLPASGFQSAQFRMIEFYSTPLNHLVHPDVRDDVKEKQTVEDLYENIYWKRGATDLKTGEKTLTLRQFEKRYTPRFLRITRQVQNSTIYHKYLELSTEEQSNTLLVEALRNFDMNANVNWLLMHMGAAYRYLNDKNKVVDATGGTNWKSYLPPSFQRISFFPNLWTEAEKQTWGKSWVDELISK